MTDQQIITQAYEEKVKTLFSTFCDAWSLAKEADEKMKRSSISKQVFNLPGRLVIELWRSYPRREATRIPGSRYVVCPDTVQLTDKIYNKH
jgi:hypothetical protein